MPYVIAFFIIFLIFLLYCVYENKNLEVSDYLVEQKNIPETLDGMRFVCLTDLHLNQFGKNNKKLIQKINECNPDMILVAGDMITSSKADSANIALDLLKTLATSYSICYAPGNHELRWSYQVREVKISYQEYVRQMKESGIQYLDNTDVTIKKGNGTLQVSGLNLSVYYYNKGRPKALSENELKQMLPPKDPQAYTILLAHAPDYFEQYVNWGADLIVSGHNHGGIMQLGRLGGVISPRYQLFPKYDSGVFKKNASVMFLSRGLGTHTIPIRIFNRPEIICFQIKKKV